MDAAPEPHLDDFELRLLRLVAEGHGVRRVTRTLAISESTLRRKMTVVQQKLGANGRVNAVYIGAKRGLI